MQVSAISFLFFLLVFVAIGALSVLKSKGTNSDYLLASSSVPAWLVGLSAVATNNSGYMFVGQIGFTYLYGLSSIWLMFGWIIGDLLISFLVHKRLRHVSEQRQMLSFGGALAGWFGGNFQKLRLWSGLLTVVFLGIYAAAQLKAGSKALFVLFEWSYETGAVLGALMVLIYCLAGGIRASIWTDAAQSGVMLVAMALLFFKGVDSAGGLSAFHRSLTEVSPYYLAWFPETVDTLVARVLWVTGWLFAGFAIVGLPHVMIRFMALRQPEHMTRARWCYYSWYTAFYALAIGVGLTARTIIPNEAAFDPELALPMLSQLLLNPLLTGLVLAGLFAATMSTADSLILSCSAAFVRDIFPKARDSYHLTKTATFSVTIGALVIALWGGGTVFTLVLIAISVLASAFGPIIICYASGIRLREYQALSMSVLGATIAIVWRMLGGTEHIYELAPGMTAPLILAVYFKLRGLTDSETQNHSAE